MTISLNLTVKSCCIWKVVFGKALETAPRQYTCACKCGMLHDLTSPEGGSSYLWPRNDNGLLCHSIFLSILDVYISRSTFILAFCDCADSHRINTAVFGAWKMIYLFFFFLGQESCHIHPGNRPLTSCVPESDLAGYLCQWMMAVWLQVVADQKCSCPGWWRWPTCTMYGHDSTDVGLSTLSYFHICMLLLLLVAHLWNRIPLKAPNRLHWAWASKTKSCCKNIKNFVMLVKIKGPSVRYVLCALCPKSKWEFELPKGL